MGCSTTMRLLLEVTGVEGDNDDFSPTLPIFESFAVLTLRPLVSAACVVDWTVVPAAEGEELVPGLQF